jgi:hypothetical protein
VSKLLTLTLESGEKAKVPFNETSQFRITTRTFPDPAAGPVDVEQSYTGVVGATVSEGKGADPLPPQPGATGFESEEAAIAFAAELPTGVGAAHLEQALTKWPKSTAIKDELEVYDAEIRATPNDSMAAGTPVTPAGTPVPPTPAEPEPTPEEEK